MSNRFLFEEALSGDGGGGGGGDAGSILNSDPAPAPVPAAAPPLSDPNAPPPVAAPVGITFPDNWKEGLPEELRAETALGVIQDIPSLAKSYIHAQKQIGADKIVLPSKHATPDDWKAVYQKLGQPADLKDYVVDVPKEGNFDDGFITDFKKFAHEANILPAQANNLLKWYAEANNSALANERKSIESETSETIGRLKREWGETYNTNIIAARNAIKEAAGEGAETVFSWLDSSGLGSNETLIKLFSHFGNMMKEDSIVGDTPQGPSSAPTQLQDQVDEIMGNKEHPYWVGTHPNHKKAVGEMESLMKRLSPDEQAEKII